MKIYFYQIYQNSNPEIKYIGSTNNKSARKSIHKKNTTNRVSKKYWFKLYKHIRENGGWSSFTFEVIETGEYATRSESFVRERELIRIMEPFLNTMK